MSSLITNSILLGAALGVAAKIAWELSYPEKKSKCQVECTIASPKKNSEVTVTLKNLEKEKMFISKVNLPWDSKRPYQSFTLTNDKNTFPLGQKYSFYWNENAKPEDYIQLLPGQSQSTTINIADKAKETGVPPGNYNLQFTPTIHDCYLGDKFIMRASLHDEEKLDIKSNVILINIDK